MKDGKVSIAFFLSFLGGGGTERIVVNIVNNLDRQKYNVSLVLGCAKGGLFNLIKKGVPIVDLNVSGDLKLFFEREETLAFWAGIILLVSAVFQYVNSQWISLTLGIAGVLIILIGILGSDKTERLGGLLLLGLTLGRVIFVDLAGLGIIFKIITFIVLGILFVGTSFIYNRFNVEPKTKT